MKSSKKILLIIILIGIVLYLILSPIINKNQIISKDNLLGKSEEIIKLELKEGNVSGEYINEHTDNLEINVNEFDYMLLTSLSADFKPQKLTEFPEEFKFIGVVDIPKDFDLTSYYTVYTRSDLDIDVYDQLHDYVLYYENTKADKLLDNSGEVLSDKNRNIIISMSYIESPMRDYYAQDSSEFVKSKLGNLECEIQKYYDIYIAKFKIDNTYFDIETLGVSQDELVSLIISINNGFVKFGKKNV